MDLTIRRRVCELVAGIIATDSELHPAELKFMLKTFEAFGIASGKDDEAVCPTVSSAEAAKAIRDLPEDVRRETVSLLIDSAVSDGKVTPAERDYLLAVARAAGLSDTAVDEALAERLLGHESGEP
jgi:uncharacterized tellurite resistance protein B-like protein